MPPLHDCVSLVEIAGRWAALFFPVLIKISLLLAMLVAATRLMRRASASARHLLLTLGIAGMLLLPLMEAILPSWRVVPVPDRWVPAPTGDNSPSGDSPQVGFVAVWNADIPGRLSRLQSAAPGVGPGTEGDRVPVASGGLPADGNDPAESLLSKAATLPVAVWCFSIWLVGLCAHGIALIRAMLSLDRLKRGARPLTGEGWPELLQELSRELGLASPPALFSSPRVSTPMTWGLRRPVVLMPEACRHWGADQRREVLLHETAHIKRCDCLTQFVAQLARLIYWFNPLVAVVAGRMRTERERACDDRVLMDGTLPSSYAGHLLAMASCLRNRDCMMPTSVAMARRGGIFDRLDAVLDTRQCRSEPGYRLGVAAVTLIFCVVLGLAVLGGCSFYKGSYLATSWISRTDNEVLTARIRGEIAFTYDETGIRSMGEDAYFALSTKGDPGRVRIEVEPDAGESLRLTYSIDGRTRSFDDGAEVWLAERLPAALRELAVNVEPRIRRIYASEGADGVLAEVDRLTSDRAKRQNLSAYFALDGLTREETLQGLVRMRGLFCSPYELSRLLEEISPLVAHDESVRQAYFAAVDEIWSPHEQVRLLSTILHGWMGNEQVLSAVAAALRRVKSDYEVARLLDSIQSDTDRSRLIQDLGSVTFSGEQGGGSYGASGARVSSERECAHPYGMSSQGFQDALKGIWRY